MHTNPRLVKDTYTSPELKGRLRHLMLLILNSVSLKKQQEGREERCISEVGVNQGAVTVIKSGKMEGKKTGEKKFGEDRD